MPVVKSLFVQPDIITNQLKEAGVSEQKIKEVAQYGGSKLLLKLIQPAVKLQDINFERFETMVKIAVTDQQVNRDDFIEYLKGSKFDFLASLSKD